MCAGSRQTQTSTDESGDCPKISESGTLENVYDVCMLVI